MKFNNKNNLENHFPFFLRYKALLYNFIYANTTKSKLIFLLIYSGTGA